VVDLFECFADDGRTQLVIKQIDRLLSGESPVWPIEPDVSLRLIGKYAVGERPNLKDSD
jgi:hypothetical protein